MMNDPFLPGLRSASYDYRVDLAERLLSRVSGNKIAGLGENTPEVTVIHRFAPGLYIRECQIPANYTLTTKIHKTQHFYLITKGHVKVFTEHEGAQELYAPANGITLPGTRRVIHALANTHWLTFHPTQLTDPVEIEREIIEERLNPLLEAGT